MNKLALASMLDFLYFKKCQCIIFRNKGGTYRRDRVLPDKLSFIQALLKKKEYYYALLWGRQAEDMHKKMVTCLRKNVKN